MQLRSLSEGDLVSCNVRGRTFEARFIGMSDSLPGRVRVDPVDTRLTYHHVKKTEIKQRVKGKR